MGSTILSRALAAVAKGEEPRPGKVGDPFQSASEMDGEIAVVWSGGTIIRGQPANPMELNEQSQQEEIAALTAFCVHNEQLDKLNSNLAEFNLFEAAGLTRDEVKHSRFLSFLLNPKEAHGLGDALLTRLLQRAIEDSHRDDLPVSPLDLELWDLSDTEVFTEWSNIDLLVLNHTHKLAVVIENKIGTGEHSDQLNRYYSLIAQHYPKWSVLPLFLSPAGDKPTDDRYIPVTYELVADLLDHFTTTRASTLSTAVLTTLQHYTQLLRRHVLSDSKVKELCQEIYRKHRKALDLIFEYRQDHLAGIKEYISSLIGGDERLERGQQSPTSTTFIPISWKEWMPQSQDISWSKDGLLALFWFEISDGGVRLILEIGPGDRKLAQKLLDAAQANRPLFDPQSKTVGRKWNRIVRSRLVSAAAIASGDQERIQAEFEAAWSRFTEQDMAEMEQVLERSIVAPHAEQTHSAGASE